MFQNIKDVMANAFGSYGEFFGQGLYVALFWLAFVWLILFEKDKKKKMFFGGELAAFSIVYFFPVTAYLIMNYCIGFSVYWRMFWLLPVTTLIAYVLTRIVDYGRKLWKRGLVAVLILLAVIQGGNLVYNEENFSIASNYYKLNQDVLVVCDAVEKDAKENGAKRKGIVVPNRLVTEIRQYDASLRMPYGRNALRGEAIPKTAAGIYQALNSSSPDMTAMAYYAKKGKYQYFVNMTGERVEEIFNAGYRFVENVGNYDVYRMEDMTYGKRDLLVTQYGDASWEQGMFYIIRDYKNKVIVIDGGGAENAEYVRQKLLSVGGRVDAWILTHPKAGYIGAFCEIYQNLNGIRVRKVYAVDDADFEDVDEDAYQQLLDLDIKKFKRIHVGDNIKRGRITIRVRNEEGEKSDGQPSFFVKGKTQKLKLTEPAAGMIYSFGADQGSMVLK